MYNKLGRSGSYSDATTVLASETMDSGRRGRYFPLIALSGSTLIVRHGVPF